MTKFIPAPADVQDAVVPDAAQPRSAELRTASATGKSRWRQLRHVTVKAIRSVVLIEDAPYRIAIGSAAGIFTSVLPMIGQMFLGMLLARMLRGSVVASTPWTWLSNPLTTVPIWYGCYRTGLGITGGEALPVTKIKAIVSEFTHLSGSEFFQRGFTVIGDIAVPTLVGSIVIGLIAGALGYIIIHRAVVALHRRRARVRAGWRERLDGDCDPAQPLPGIA